MPFSQISRQAFLADLRHYRLTFEEKDWVNYTEEVVQPNAVVVQVDSIDQIPHVMLALKARNDAIKAANGGTIPFQKILEDREEIDLAPKLSAKRAEPSPDACITFLSL